MQPEVAAGQGEVTVDYQNASLDPNVSEKDGTLDYVVQIQGTSTKVKGQKS